MPEVPVKLYIDKVLKACRKTAPSLGSIPAPVKDRALRAMAARLLRDEDAILAANEKDVDALGKSFGAELSKDRLKAAVARVRMVAADVKEMAERLAVIADRPDPVGAVTGRWERPDGLIVSRVRVPIGVIGIISELKPLVTVESIALCLKSGNLSVFRGSPDWALTHEVIGKALREAAQESGIPDGAWVLVERPEKEIAVELIRAGKALDAIIPRGGAGLRKAVVDGAKMPVLCHDGGLTHLYVDADVDLPLVQNVVINSKVQLPGATNALDTLLVQQGVARHFLAALINRLLVEFKVDVRGCPKTLALMGQMPISGHTSIVPATDEDWNRQFQAPTLAIKMVVDMDEALAHIAEHGLCMTAVIATSNYSSALRFTREADAAAVFVNASSRLHDAEGFGFGSDIGLSSGRLHAKGPIGLEQLTCEKYVVF
ncbi:MAG TPA: glutamate-5-semialdehyde dehydrogenase, partial [Nitrospira sp.]|nr:glutamate-5-semialdehyde dehydrogenase [Nitrospira sp.]